MPENFCAAASSPSFSCPPNARENGEMSPTQKSDDLLPQLIFISLVRAQCCPLHSASSAGSAGSGGLWAVTLLCSASFCWCHGVSPCRGTSALCIFLLLAVRCKLLEQYALHRQFWKEEKKPKSAWIMYSWKSYFMWRNNLRLLLKSLGFYPTPGLSLVMHHPAGGKSVGLHPLCLECCFLPAVAGLMLSAVHHSGTIS